MPHDNLINPEAIFKDYYELFDAHNSLRTLLGDKLFEDRRLLFAMNKIMSHIENISDLYADQYIESIIDSEANLQEYLLNASKLSMQEGSDYLIRVEFLLTVIYRAEYTYGELDNIFSILDTLLAELTNKFYTEHDELLIFGIPVKLDKVLSYIRDKKSINKMLAPTIDRVVDVLAREDDDADTYIEHILTALNVLYSIRTEDAFNSIKKVCQKNIHPTITEEAKVYIDAFKQNNVIDSNLNWI